MRDIGIFPARVRWHIPRGAPLLIRLGVELPNGTLQDLSDADIVFAIYRRADGEELDTIIGAVDGTDETIFVIDVPAETFAPLFGQSGLAASIVQLSNAGAVPLFDGPLEIMPAAAPLQGDGEYGPDGGNISLTWRAAGLSVILATQGAPGRRGPPGSAASVMVIDLAVPQFTPSLAHAGEYMRLNSALPMQLIVPSNATVAFEIGAQMAFVQRGLGSVTIAPAVGVVVNSAETLRTRKQFSGFSLVKVGVNEWDAIGDFEGI